MKRTSILRRAGAAVALSVLVGLRPGGAVAQSPQAEIAADFERMRGNVLQYVEAMPADALGFAPTEDVRSFAEQIEHVAAGNVGIVASALGIDEARRPDLGDQEAYLTDRAALRDHVNRSFDWVAATVRNASDAELREATMLFGQAEVSRERALRTAYEHGIWTLGQIIPYLRLNGVTPPAYGLVPGGS